MKYPLLHYIAHLLGWNHGRVVTRFDDKSYLWMGFECGTCGKVERAERISILPLPNIARLKKGLDPNGQRRG